MYNENKLYFDEFLKEISGNVKIKSYLSIKRHLNIFLEFLKVYSFFLLEITKEQIETYKNYLLKLYNPWGKFYPASWYKNNFVHVNALFNWLIAKHYIKVKPFPNGINLKIMFEIYNLFEKRRLEFFQINFNKYSDKDIVKTFKKHIKSYYSNRNHIRYHILMIDELFKFIKSKGIRLTENHLNNEIEIKNHFFSLEQIPYRRYKFSFIKKLIERSKYFFTWLYEHGYSEFNSLEFLNVDNIEYEFNEFHSIEQKELHKRYYTTNEVLRKYKRFLYKTRPNESSVKKVYSPVLKYIDFLESIKKTLYTSKEKEVNLFLEYFAKAKSFSGTNFKESTQLDFVTNIRRFYEWFCGNRHIKENPFKNYNSENHLKIIKEFKNYTHHRKKNFVIPVAFRKVYEDVSLYEVNKGFTQDTIKEHKRGWKCFFKYLEKQNIKDLNEVDENILNEYQIYLNYQKNWFGELLSLGAKYGRLIGLRKLYEYLLKFRLIERDPSHAISLPKRPYGLIQYGINDKEAMSLIEQSNSNSDIDKRNRAILEMLYSSGIRNNELCKLKLKNIDYEHGFILVDVPKGGKALQRVVPIGKSASHYVKRYIDEVRSKNIFYSSDYLFINDKGNPYSTRTILTIVKNNAQKTQLKKRRVITHSFRVACATEMLRHGADVKHVQEQLGHISIRTTDRYIRLNPTDLKKAHKKFHPRDKKFEKEQIQEESKKLHKN